MLRLVLILGVWSVVGLQSQADESNEQKSTAAASSNAVVETEATAKISREEEAIREQLRAYVQTFNTHDAAKVVAYWTADAVSVNVDSGERTVGRKRLQEDFTKFFEEHPKSQLSGQVDSLRNIRPDVALAEGHVTLLVSESEPVETAFSAILVKEDGKWLISNSQERSIPTPESAADALSELEWLVGHWQDDTDDALVDTTVRWSENRAFLIRAFHVEHLDGETFQGTQVIGWDPLNKQIRTWTFNSDGSFGEGFASKNGDDWMLKMSHIQGDGRVSTGTQVITRVDDNTIRVQTIGETLDGQPIPASDPVTVVRVDDAPATEAEATKAEAVEVETSDKGVSP